MSLKRGEVVIVDWPFASGKGRKPRPALIVQNDRDNQRLVNTVLAMITSVTKRALEATQLLIELNTAEGKQSGLMQDSVVNCSQLLTVERSRILYVIGSLPPAIMQQIDECLKAALGIP
jgi:mRNA interferase MazF